jgi:hypothetical protein
VERVRRHRHRHSRHGSGARRSLRRSLFTLWRGPTTTASRRGSRYRRTDLASKSIAMR